MTELFTNKNECCGCSACARCCPAGAVTMAADSEGFLYPQIDGARCTDCGICQKVCAFKKVSSDKISALAAYAAKHKDDAVRQTSTSGGVFTALSDVILNKGGAVYGAAYADSMQVKHERADTKARRDAFKGSKYAQSDLGDIFSRVERDLADGKAVLFSGTPCQVDGLRSFLRRKPGIDERNLTLCDIICYGVPSPLIWKEHVHFLEKKHKSRLTSYSFRSKKYGWNKPVEEGVYQNGFADSKSLVSQIFMRLFYQGRIFRPSCHVCPYTRIQRPSDITIADFWGVEKTMPDFHDQNGVSLVLVNSEKGRELLDAAACDIELLAADKDTCMRHNLQNPSHAAPDREQFWTDYRDNGYVFILKKYANYNVKGYLKWTVKKLIKPR